VLELDGVSVMTNDDGSYLGDSRFDPIFAESDRRTGPYARPTRQRQDRDYVMNQRP
jgi:hypothetical protein